MALAPARPPTNAFSGKEPLGEGRRPLLAAIADVAAAVRERAKGLVKAVKAPERELPGTPIPPEAVVAAHGPLVFSLKRA